MMRELPMAMVAPAQPSPMDGDEAQTAQGLRYNHQQMITLAQATFAAAAQAAALANVLYARGVITREELAAQRAEEERRLDGIFKERRVGVQLDGSAKHSDKYAIPPEALPDIDCAARYHLCRAACCSLTFPLTLQDLDEGVVRWEYGQPYMIRHAADDRCVHQDRATGRCTVYANRPGTCRTYSCRHDGRIWADFDRRIINPNLFVEGPDGELHLQFPREKVTRRRTESGEEVVEVVPDGYASEHGAAAGAADQDGPDDKGGGIVL